MFLLNRIFLALTLWCGIAGSLSAQSSREKWEPAIRAFEKQDSLTPVKPGGNLFVGSSTFTRWKDLDDYFPGKHVINRGFGGSQFPDLMLFIDRIIVPYRPKTIFVYEGDNDLAAGKSPEDVVERAIKLNQEIRDRLPKARVVLISAKPSISRWHLKEKYVAYNALLKDYARTAKRTEFVDVWTSLLDKGGQPMPHIYAEDKLHLNGEGYKLVQTQLKKWVK